MKDTICNQVRLEINEAELSTPLSMAAMEHLKECADCKVFHSKETKLRQIIGSLEPVNAPADFDFRLRARLASDRSRTSLYSAAPLHLFRSRSFAVAAMLLVFAAMVVVIRQASRQDPVRDTTTTASSREQVAPITSPSAMPVSPTKPTNGGTNSTVAVNDTTKPVRRPLSSASTNRRPSATIDFSDTPAPVIRGEQSMATMATFPLDVSKQSFKVWLDDAHGASKTILVPNVSFGAGRALTGTAPVNQFAPKGDW